MLHVREPVDAPPWLDSCAPWPLPCNGFLQRPMCQPTPRAEGSPCRNLPTGADFLAQQTKFFGSLGLTQSIGDLRADLARSWLWAALSATVAFLLRRRMNRGIAGRQLVPSRSCHIDDIGRPVGTKGATERAGISDTKVCAGMGAWG
jgi:hypothetical protein